MGRPSSIILLSENYRTLSEEYYTHHRKIGFTANSTRARQLAVNEFLSWLEWQGLLTIEKIETQHIIGYYNYISERPSKKNGGVLSQKSTFSQITSIKHLFSMLQSKGRMKNNPSNTLNFPYPKEQKEKEILIQSEIKLLYKVSISALERAILSLAYGCGLRVGELEQVKTEDIRLREKILIVPKGKGNKRRVIPLSPGVMKDLSNYYFNERDLLSSGRAFEPLERAFILNSTGSRMREYTFNKQLKRIINRAIKQGYLSPEIALKEITIHSLRHSIATHLIEQGVKLEQVRQFLGHSQLETTQGYTRVSQKQLKDLINDET